MDRDQRSYIESLYKFEARSNTESHRREVARMDIRAGLMVLVVLSLVS